MTFSTSPQSFAPLEVGAVTGSNEDRQKANSQDTLAKVSQTFALLLGVAIPAIVLSTMTGTVVGMFA
jgi:hypothetical protein